MSTFIISMKMVSWDETSVTYIFSNPGFVRHLRKGGYGVVCYDFEKDCVSIVEFWDSRTRFPQEHYERDYLRVIQVFMRKWRKADNFPKKTLINVG